MPDYDSNSETETYFCPSCNKHYDNPSQFHKTNSKLYTNNGYMPICKEHLGILFRNYTVKYGSVKMAMQRICMAFDLYYNDSLFEKSNNGTEATLGNYIKYLNMIQYRGRTFETSIEEGFVFGENQTYSKPAKTKEVDEEKPKANPKDVKRWGDGFDVEDYEILNSHCDLLKSANPNCDSNQEIFINDLCYIKMQQMKALREGNIDDFGKMTESYRKTFSQANLKTVQNSDVNNDDCWGEWMGIIGKYTPEEYYKDKQLYKDYDNVGQYFQRHVLRPLRNIKFGTRDRDSEFCVKDDGDDYEYADSE